MMVSINFSFAAETTKLLQPFNFYIKKNVWLQFIFSWWNVEQQLKAMKETIFPHLFTFQRILRNQKLWCEIAFLILQLVRIIFYQVWINMSRHETRTIRKQMIVITTLFAKKYLQSVKFIYDNLIALSNKLSVNWWTLQTRTRRRDEWPTTRPIHWNWLLWHKQPWRRSG